jgi:hypothetical protein
MKITNFRRAVASALVAGGLLFAGANASALTVHSVGDPGFEGIGLGAGDYYFFQGPPNSPFWKDHANSSGKNRAYNTFWGFSTSPDTPDPHGGNQAVDGEGAYNYQVLDDVFVEGRTYTYSMYTQGWGNNASDANDRLWLYLFAGVDGNDADADLDDAPGDEGAGGNMDGSSIKRAAWHQNGVIDSVGGVGTGAFGALPFSGFNRSAGSAWTQVGLIYTATAADAGKRIGLGFWANNLGAVDDVALTSVPEPATGLLLGAGLLGGAGLLRRRRKD